MGRVLVVACIVFGFGCVIDSMAPPEPVSTSSREDFRRATARGLALGLDESAREELVARLRDVPSLALADIAGFERASAPAGLVPEVWLTGDIDGPADRLLVAYAPSGDEHSWRDISAFAPSGRELFLSAEEMPDVPVLVVETAGRLSMAAGIERANRMLRDAGLQALPSIAHAGGERWTHKLDAIELQDDMEPWISGDAEIYAIASSVVGENPTLHLAELPYLETDAKGYAPNQIVLDWNNYDYQVANLQLFEHDDNTNYQDLVVALISAVGAGGTLAGYPEVQAVSEIANRIIQAMPAGWFSNDDDYVDSYYTLEKQTGYVNHAGVAGNARITLHPYKLEPN